MAKSKAQKQESLKEIAEIIKTATAVVFAGFDKLTVGEVTEARRAMRASGVRLLTVKKTLLSKVLKESTYAVSPEFPGKVALAYSQDLLAPAREVLTVGKKLEEKLSILGGLFEGVYTDKEKMTTIALIPSREVLLGQFVNLINSPIQGLVIGLDAIAKKKTA